MKEFIVEQVIKTPHATYVVWLIDEIKRTCILENGISTSRFKCVTLYNKENGKTFNRKVDKDEAGEYVKYGTGVGRDRVLNTIIHS